MDSKFTDALARFNAYAENDRHNRDDALDDLKHLSGDQWDERVRRSRESLNKPVITINKLIQFVNQINGDWRQAQPVIEFIPSDNETHPVMADIMNGLVRRIEYQSNAGAAYAWANQGQISCGIGHVQIATDYGSDDDFNQEIYIRRIVDHLAVIWESGSNALDRSDAQECFVTEMLTKEAFEKRFPKVKIPQDFPKAATYGDQSTLRWYDDGSRKIRLGSHWWKEPVKKTIGMTKYGQVLDLSQYKPDQYQFLGITRTRDVDAHKVMHCLMSGVDYLEDAKEWIGSHIPIVPFLGNEIVVDGKLIRHGIVRHAKDPQRLYNYFRSIAAQVIAEQPKSPWIGPSKAFIGLEEFWKKANTDSLPYLPYHVDPDTPNLKPERVSPPQGSTVMYDEVKVAEADMYGTTGIYPAALGQRSNETSGKAIKARQAESDTGTFLYFDNAKAAFHRLGVIIQDLAPKVYDAEQTIRILGKDGTESMASINMIRNDPFHGPVIINDLSSAKFDVRVKTGTGFANAREQAHDALASAIQADPNLMGILGDLYFESLDLPISAKLAARMKATMPQSIVGEGGMAPPQPDPVKIAAVQAEIASKNASAADKGALAQGRQIDNAHKAYALGHSSATIEHAHPVLHQPAQ
jgi:hypothetical protein